MAKDPADSPRPDQDQPRRSRRRRSKRSRRPDSDSTGEARQGAEGPRGQDEREGSADSRGGRGRTPAWASEAALPFYKRKAVRRTFLVLVCVGVLLFCYGLRNVFNPLLISLLIAYILNPVVNWLEGRGVRRVLAVVAIYMCVLGPCLAGMVFLGTLVCTDASRVRDVLFGEELWEDVNGNGRFDPGEPITHDADKDGVYDPDTDRYEDLNENGQYDPAEVVCLDRNGNGRYDPGILERAYIMLWEGDQFEDRNGNGLFEPAEVLTRDLNGNGRYDPGDEFEDLNGNEKFDPPEKLTRDANGNGQYDEGDEFEDANGNGVFDPGDKLTVDVDGNGRCEEGDAFDDRDGNGRFDPGDRLTEDVNGNGRYDPDQDKFEDVNGNGRFDPGDKLRVDRNRNGQYDPGLLKWIVHVLPGGTGVAAAQDLDATTLYQKLRTSMSGKWNTAAGMLKDRLGWVWRTTNNVLLLLGNLILCAVYTFFFMLEMNVIGGVLFKYLPGPERETVVDVLTKIHRAVSSFFRGRLIVCAFVGLLTGLGLTLLDVRFAILLGVLTGVGNMVPFLGVVIGLMPALFFSFVEHHSMLHMVFVFIMFSAVQGAEGTILVPLVMGKQVEMHPVTLIVALLIGGQLFGLFGVLVAIPLACILRILGAEFVLPELRQLSKDKT